MDSKTTLIRPWRPDDAGALHAAVRASLSPWLPWATPGYDLAQAEGWIAFCTRMRETDAEHHFGVFDADSGVLLGSVGLNQRIAAHRCANLGYWVVEAVRGHGIAVAAARQAVRFGFDTLGLRRITIQVVPENRASLRVAMKLGAVCEGIARNGLLVGETSMDAMVHSLIPDDMALWEAQDGPAE
jgi:RimJ/RimL family protein N-acetyltransferase